MDKIKNISIKDIDFNSIYTNRADAEAGKNAVKVNKINFGNENDVFKYNTETGLISKKTSNGQVPMGYSKDIEVIDLSLDSDSKDNMTISNSSTIPGENSKVIISNQTNSSNVTTLSNTIPTENNMTKDNNSDTQINNNQPPLPTSVPAENDIVKSIDTDIIESDNNVINQTPLPTSVPAENDIVKNINKSTPNATQNQNISPLPTYVPGEIASNGNLTSDEINKLRQLGIPSSDYNLLSLRKEKIDQLIGPKGDWIDFYNKYKDFSNMLDDTKIDLGFGSKYVPQGLCTIENETFITQYQEGEKSIIRYYDNNGKLKIVKLDLPEGSHVGGISYDSNSKNFYICSENGGIAVFSRDSIVNSTNDVPVKPTNEFQSGYENSSYITIHNDKLYVGTFKKEKQGSVKEFSLQNGSSPQATGYEFSVPEKVQGLAFYTNSEGKTTMATSCSYGRTNNSSLKLFDFDKTKSSYTNPKADIKAPPMSEQLSFNEDGKLNCIFESGSEKYHTEKALNEGQPIKSTCVLNIKQYIK